MIYAFGPFRLEPAERRLLRDGEPIALPPRVFDLLVALVERRERLIGKRELLDTVWAGAFVEEANLSVTISALRKALGDDPDGHAYIETVRGRGYRFVAPVRVLEATTEDPAATNGERAAAAASVLDSVRHAPRGLGRRAIWVAAALAAIVLLALLATSALSRTRRRTVRPRIETLAILPFRTAGAPRGHDPFGLGLADALITRMGRLDRLVVRPTSAVVRYADRSTDAAAAGRELGADAVLGGLVQRAAGRVRATLQLVSTGDGSVLWAESFDEPAGDVFALQDAISTRVAAALTLELSGKERQTLTRHFTASPEAYELYLRGRYHWFQWTPEGWLKARSYYEQAIARDPQFALAYAGVAESYGVMSFVSPPAETAVQGKQMALRAVALDPQLAEAHLALGPRYFFYDWDWRAAEASYRRALALAPHEALAWDVWGIYLYAMGRTSEAVAAARRALELDPLSSYMGWDYGEALYFDRRFEAAAAALEATLAREAGFYPARFSLALVRDRQGRQADAVAEYLRAARAAGIAPEEEAVLREAEAGGGTAAFWRRRLAQLDLAAQSRYVPAFEPAVIAARLGERELACRALERGFRERAPEMIRLGVDPALDPLRDEPCFRDLLRRLKLGG